MKTKRNAMIVLASLLLIGLAISVVIAADDEQTPGEGAGNRPQQAGTRTPGQGEFRDRANFQQRMSEMIKSELGATDEEWTVIEPRLTKVMTLSRDVNQRGMGMMRGGRRGFEMGGRGGRDRPEQPPQTSQSEQSEIQKATNALQEALDKSDSTPDDVKAKLLALRNAKEKTKQELAKAQQELKQILSVRQEAKLVLLGLLD
jgi:flagellar motility protein MotE (MotC chaperone)